MVALECVDGFGVAQSPPLVPLDRIGFCQHFQLLCDALVVILLLAVRGMSTNPLAGRLSHGGRAVSGLLRQFHRVAARNQCFQIPLGDTSIFSFAVFIVKDFL